MNFPIRLTLFISIISICFLNTGCLKKIALKKVAGALTSGDGTVFTGDNDPQLIADALPFALKTYESLLSGLPDDENLLYATGQAFCMYAYAFVQVPADTISDSRIKEKTEHYLRAKKLYLRARDYLLKALELRHPGFNDLLNSNRTDSALSLLEIADSSLIYWTGASWMGAFTADKFDMKLALNMPKAVALMKLLLENHESFGNGMVHDFFISYFGSMPPSMGGNEQKARYHFSRSLELSKGKSAGSYVSLATSVCISNQYHEEFQKLLNQALAIDADAYIPNRLANTLSQNRARWLLDHMDNFFILNTDSDDESDDEFENEIPENPETSETKDTEQ
ncbi:MAG: TRAP transporter TatT component family protein [Chitinispirillia bacterium]|jgi:predicted anti-sigma-YlaC factor YlaD